MLRAMEVLGRYELVRKLATGGMADVFLARQWGDGGFHRPVLVKRMHAHLAENPVTVHDFRNEALLMAELAHPGIPAIFDFRFDGSWLLAMEYVPGPTLGACRKHAAELGQSIPWSAVLNLMIGLCDVLSFVHERRDAAGDLRGIVHGDLGPENVIVGRDGRVRLIDFGIAGDRAHRETQREHVKGMRGTMGYVAPECVSGALGDARSDQFVVGVLLHELSTGKRVFPEDQMHFLDAVKNRAVPKPSERRPKYPAAIEAIVMRAMARDPAKRFESVHVLGEALRGIAVRSKVPLRPEVLSRYAAIVSAPDADPALPGRDAAPMPTVAAPGLPEIIDEGALSKAEHEEILADLDEFLLPFEDELEPPQTQTRAKTPGDVPPTPGATGEDQSH